MLVTFKAKYGCLSPNHYKYYKFITHGGCLPTLRENNYFMTTTKGTKFYSSNMLVTFKAKYGRLSSNHNKYYKIITHGGCIPTVRENSYFATTTKGTKSVHNSLQLHAGNF